MIQRNPPLTSRTRPRHRPASRRVRGRPRRGRRLCSASRLRRRRRGFRRRSPTTNRRMRALPARARRATRFASRPRRSTTLCRSSSSSSRANDPRWRARNGVRWRGATRAERARSRVIVRGRCAPRDTSQKPTRRARRSRGWTRPGGTTRCTNIWRRGFRMVGGRRARRRRWWRRYRARSPRDVRSRRSSFVASSSPSRTEICWTTTRRR